MELHQPQVGEELAGVNRRQLVDALQLDEDLLIHQQIGSKSFLEDQPVEFEADRLLPLDTKSPPLERLGKQHLVDRLQHSRPETAMYPERCIDHGSRDLVERPARRHRSSVPFSNRPWWFLTESTEITERCFSLCSLCSL